MSLNSTDLVLERGGLIYELSYAARREIIAQIPAEYRFITSDNLIFDSRYSAVQYTIKQEPIAPKTD